MTIQTPCASEGPAQVVARHGARAEVKTETGLLMTCALRQNLGTVVAGDHVLVSWAESVIVAVLPRKSLLTRYDERGQQKTIAANVDQLIVVVALEPLYSLDHLDAYLIFGELQGIKPIIVLNKVDLYDNTAMPSLQDWLSIYRHLNYTVIETSLKTDLHPLEAELRGHCSIFVGQSGVGKSSLLSRLLPEAMIKVGDFNADIGHGQHTTSTTRMYDLPTGGALMDSPGIRELQLGAIPPADLIRGFIEFQPYLYQCKYRNCIHKHEPGCAIIKAVEAGHIHPKRFQYYHYLLSKSGSRPSPG